MVENITLTDNSGNVVTIGASLVDEVWNNQLHVLTTPRSESDSDRDTKIINLNRTKRLFDIDGIIYAGGDAAAGDFSGSDTVEQQRTKLRNMADTVRNITMDYGSASDYQNLSGVIQKISIKEEAKDDATPSFYTVKISFIEGTNVITGEG